MQNRGMSWLDKLLTFAAVGVFFLCCFSPFVATSYTSSMGTEEAPTKIDGYLNGFECLGVGIEFDLAFLCFAASIATLRRPSPIWCVVFSFLALLFGTTVFTLSGQTYKLMPGDPKYLLGPVQYGAVIFWLATLALPAAIAIWKNRNDRLSEQNNARHYIHTT